VWDDGVQCALGAGRQRALLALLVLRRNEVVSVDRIIDALWGEQPPATAQKVVQGYISQLRKAVGAETLVTHPWGYGLRASPGSVDAEEFERLVDRARGEDPARAVETLSAAIGLWRGPALADVAYESFAQGEIARLEGARLAAVEDRIDAELALGWEQRLVPELEALVHDQPLRERLRGQLILALYRSGRQAEALELYAESRRRFVDEWGIEPGPELQELQRQILAQDPALGPMARQMPLVIVARQRWRLIAAGAAVVAAMSIAVALGLARGESRHVAAGPNMVAALDPQTNRLVDAFSVGSVPTQLAIGGNAVWVLNSNDRTVSRVEPGTRSVRTVSTGTDVAGIAVGSDSAWVANGLAGTVSRIDLRSAEVRRTIKLPRGRQITSIDAGPFDVWVSGIGRQPPVAWRIDPRTNEVTRTVPLDHLPRTVAIVGGSVWIRNDFGIVRLDRRTGRLEHRLALASHGCCEWGGLAVGEGSLWAVGIARGVLWRLDARAGVVAATIPLHGQHPVNLISSTNPAGAAVGAGAVWVADANGAILKINPNTNDVVARIPVQGVPSGLAFGFGRLWIALD
jgi:DNA-binding SARP family transcriptional activator